MIIILLLFILSCIRASFYFLRLVIISVLLPRMPLPNWRKEENISAGQVVDDNVIQVEEIIINLWDRASTNGPGHDFANGDEDAARFENPIPSTNYALSVGFAFSIYSNHDSATPQHYSNTRGPFLPSDSATFQNYSNTRDPFLTPVRPQPVKKEVGSTMLRDASDRVTEILRENRRRLDAGEDPSTIRKAARRKRAMELSAIRKGRAKLISLA